MGQSGEGALASSCFTYEQGWKFKPKPKSKNPVLKEIFQTQTETDNYSAQFLKT